MSEGTRVLVVDDSVVVRRLVSGILAEDPSIGRVDVASDGRVALARIERDEPDIVVLDIEMPGLSGLQVLARIRARHPAVRVIMFSVFTERGAETTLDALSLGACDYVGKPGSGDPAEDVVRGKLLPRIKALMARATESEPPRTRPAGAPADVVVAAASTGGPDALVALLAPLPATFPLPIVVVQHMPPSFTGPFARRLDSASALLVREARDAERLEAGRVYVAPGGRQLELAREGDEAVVTLHDRRDVPGCCPSADLCLRSAVAVYGAHTLGVVLTGMGKDALRGAAAVVDAGGTILAQDQPSSVVWGMPGHIAEAGLAHAVREPAALAALLLAAVGEGVSS